MQNDVAFFHYITRFSVNLAYKSGIVELAVVSIYNALLIERSFDSIFLSHPRHSVISVRSLMCSVLHSRLLEFVLYIIIYIMYVISFRWHANDYV